MRILERGVPILNGEPQCGLRRQSASGDGAFPKFPARAPKQRHAKYSTTMELTLRLDPWSILWKFECSADCDAHRIHHDARLVQPFPNSSEFSQETHAAFNGHEFLFSSEKKIVHQKVSTNKCLIEVVGNGFIFDRGVV